MELIGETLALRLVDLADEDFIQFLKFNGNLNMHLTTSTNGTRDFEEWYEDYKRKEKAGEEYYLIIENFNGIRYGTLRIGDVQRESCRFSNFLLLSERPATFPQESTELSCTFVFEELGLSKIYLEVLLENFPMIQMFQRIGFKENSRDERILELSLRKDDFVKGQWRESHEGNYFSWRDWI